jgi:FixJ family two-component response regulator
MPQRVLIADDEDDFLAFTTRLLVKAGYACDPVHSANEAIQALSQSPYDLLICDLNMSGNTNLELLDNLPKKAEFLPVIIVTGYPTLPSAIESLRHCVVDYLVKPLNSADLLGSVQKALSKRSIVTSLQNTRQDLALWLDQLKACEDSMIGAGDSGMSQIGSWSLDLYLNQTLNLLAKISTSIASTIDAVNRASPGTAKDVCFFLSCPRLVASKEALNDAINVLIKTKGAFKSKELAALRTKLEGVLRQLS